VLFGIIGLFGMPYQLSPSVTEPEITVSTTWPGATPYEIERDIIEEQEKVLKGIPGLLEMESSSFNNQGTITLRFKIGTEVDEALLRVSNKVNEVRSYPENVERPIINASGSATSPVIWTILKTLPGNDRPVATYRTYFENDVRQHIERVEGVADLFIGGGTEREMHVVIDPVRMAAYGLTVGDIAGVLASENVNVSAGTMGLDRRNYRIRTVGTFNSPEDIRNVVISSTGQRRVLVSDVADVMYGFEPPTVAMLHNATDGMAVGIKPEPGTNILELTNRTEKVVNDLNENKLKDQGIYLDWVYDQRPYITGAIGLVQKNIIIGGILAVTVLVIFLRSASSTIVVATAIPISVIGTFIMLGLLGRTLNVISLAGISFAVGMLVDNAIVVLENIDRHRKMGKSPYAASYDGASEVWGAILASTVTTVAVFLPVVFIQEEAGQLFRDIAIAITCSVTLSLFVSISVIPMLSKQLYALAGIRGGGNVGGAAGAKLSSVAAVGNRISNAYMALISGVLRSVTTRIIAVVALTAFAVLSVVLLFPKMEYLPQGNRNLVINILIPPPGLSYEERDDIGKHIFEVVKPHLKQESGGLPAIKNMFYVGSEQIMIFGGISEDDRRVKELLPLFKRTIFSIPGMFGISTQASIFERRIGRGRTIDVDISGEDMGAIVRAAGTMFGMAMGALEGAQVRPLPSLELLYPEVRFAPDRERLRAAGLTTEDLGVAVDVMMDGRKIGEFKEEGQKKIDLVLMAPESETGTPEQLFSSQIVVPGGGTVPVSSVATIERTYGMPEIRHLERKRTVTLQITPPEAIPLEQAMDTIREGIIPQVEAKGLLRGLDVQLSGAADKLSETRRSLQWNFLLAAFITYLLMSALFANFLYPLIIMFTIPLAGAGGFIGLKLVNIFIAQQQFDILTMLGFVILIGVVVNNAILIIHQSLNNVRLHGMDHTEAVIDSTRTRIRPIYMSALTSIFGMLPLVVAPGPGSELYRGLGSVVLGGLAFSTIFTLFVIPALLLFVIKRERPERSDED